MTHASQIPDEFWSPSSVWWKERSICVRYAAAGEHGCAHMFRKKEFPCVSRSHFLMLESGLCVRAIHALYLQLNPQSHLVYNASYPRSHNTPVRRLQRWLESLCEKFAGRCHSTEDIVISAIVTNPTDWGICVFAKNKVIDASIISAFTVIKDAKDLLLSARCFKSYWFNWCSLGHTRLQ